MALTEAVKSSINKELDLQKISRRELARRLHVSQSFVSRRLSPNGDVEFSVGEIEEIAAILGVPVSKLIPRGTH